MHQLERSAIRSTRAVAIGLMSACTVVAATGCSEKQSSTAVRADPDTVIEVVRALTGRAR